MKHVFDSTLASALRKVENLVKAKTSPAFDGIRPPGNVRRADPGGDLRQVHNLGLAAAQAPHLARATTPTMRSRETWPDLPQLPLSETDNVRRYCYLNGLAAGPL